MSKYRVVIHPDTEIPFADPPTVNIPTLEVLRQDVAEGRSWLWNYKGVVGVIPWTVLYNELGIYDNWATMRGRRERMPRGVGRFTWSQTTLLDEAENTLEATASDEAGTEGDTDH